MNLGEFEIFLNKNFYEWEFEKKTLPDSPLSGLEPLTLELTARCATNCATEALFDGSIYRCRLNLKDFKRI